MQRKQVLNYPVFDGVDVYDAATVVIENGKISRETVFGQGKTDSDFFLMPGLIDGHTHLIGKEPMDALVRHGVTATCAVGVSESIAALSDSLKIRTSRTMALGNISDGRPLQQGFRERSGDRACQLSGVFQPVRRGYEAQRAGGGGEGIIG